MKWHPYLVSSPEERRVVARDLRMLRDLVPTLVYGCAGFHLLPLSRNEAARSLALKFRLTDRYGKRPSAWVDLASSFTNLMRDGTKHPLDGYLMDTAVSYGVARVEDFPPETVRLLTKRTDADSIERELVMRYHDATGTEFHR